MSGHLPNNQYYRAAWIFGGTAAPTGAVTTCGFFTDPDFPPTDIAEALRSLWEATWLTAQVTTITLDEVVVRAGPDADGPTGSATSGQAGTHIGSGASPNTSYLVRKNTLLGGRKNRGRMYIPGVDEDKVDSSGSITGAWVTTLQGVADDFNDGLALASISPRILHELVPGPTQPTPTTIENFTVEGMVATQRHRLRR